MGLMEHFKRTIHFICIDRQIIKQMLGEMMSSPVAVCSLVFSLHSFGFCKSVQSLGADTLVVITSFYHNVNAYIYICIFVSMYIVIVVGLFII